MIKGENGKGEGGGMREEEGERYQGVGKDGGRGGCGRGGGDFCVRFLRECSEIGSSKTASVSLTLGHSISQVSMNTYQYIIVNNS